MSHSVVSCLVRATWLRAVGIGGVHDKEKGYDTANNPNKEKGYDTARELLEQ